MNAAPTEAGPGGQDPLLSDPESQNEGWAEDADDLRESGFDEPAADDSPRRAGLAASVSDAQLADWIDAIVDQDERALAALYDATFSRVFGLVQRIVRRTALAEDVVEDAYFQVWRQAARFDPARGTAMQWLLAIARSRAIDTLRREARFQHETLDDDSSAAAHSADPAPASDELLDIARHHAALHQALLQLGAQPRQLVSLAFFRGLSHEEIASQTSLPLGTVKSQIRRALLLLKQILGDNGPAMLAS